jgi:hypothetical protein
VAAIRADPVLSGQIETLVGTAFGAARLELEHVADALIWKLTARNLGFVFREAHFDEEFQHLVQRHEGTEVEVVVLGPLIGLKGDGFPIHFDEPAVDIVEFTDSEIVSCLRMGLIGQPIMSDHRFRSTGRYWVFLCRQLTRCQAAPRSSQPTKSKKCGCSTNADTDSESPFAVLLVAQPTLARELDLGPSPRSTSASPGIPVDAN